MENVIGKHLSRLDSVRNLGLIFDLDPTLIKIDDKILFLDEIVFTINDEDEIFEGIYRNVEKEGSGAYGKAGLWIHWYKNGQKQTEGNYQNGKEEGSGAYGEAGLWIYWDRNGQKWKTDKIEAKSRMKLFDLKMRKLNYNCFYLNRYKDLEI